MPLSTLADDLTWWGGSVGGGAALGALLGFLLAVIAMAWLGRVVPIERWVMWFTGAGAAGDRGP